MENDGAVRCDNCKGQNSEGMKFCGHCGASLVAQDVGTQRMPLPDVLRGFVSSQLADRLIETRGDITEERRLITAIFADLSGFTRLADRLDPDQLVEILDPLIVR